MPAASKKVACTKGQRRCRINKKLACAGPADVCDRELSAVLARVRKTNALQLCDAWEWLQIAAPAIMEVAAFSEAEARVSTEARVTLLLTKLYPLVAKKLKGVMDEQQIRDVSKRLYEKNQCRMRAMAFALQLDAGSLSKDNRKLYRTLLAEAMRATTYEKQGKEAPPALLTVKNRRTSAPCPDGKSNRCFKTQCADKNLPCTKEVTAYCRRQSVRKMLPLFRACRMIVDMTAADLRVVLRLEPTIAVSGIRLAYPAVERLVGKNPSADELAKAYDIAEKAPKAKDDVEHAALVLLYKTKKGRATEQDRQALRDKILKARQKA